MRSGSRWLAGIALGGAAALCSGTLLAQTAVLPSPAESSEVRELRVAHASAAARSTLWFSLKVYGAADDVYVLVPAPPGAVVDLSSDAFLEALSASTNPRVVPPPSAPECSPKPSAGAVEVVGSDAHQVSVAPDPAALVQSFAQVVVWAKSKGLLLTSEQTARLAELDLQGLRFVTLRFEPPSGESVTRTVRVSPASQLSAVPLLLTSAGSMRVPATVWELTSGRAFPANLPAMTVEPGKLRWSANDAKPRSNYGALVDGLLGDAKGQGWVVDAASHASLFRSTPVAAGSLSVPAVGMTYFERAAGYGDAPASYLGCAARFAALESSTAPVAKVCPRGQFAFVGTAPPSCVEKVASGETPPDELRCGSVADDLAVALSGSIPAEVWVTRWTGWIPAWTSRELEAWEPKPGPAIGPVFTATGYEDDCKPDAGTDAGSSGTGKDGGSAGSTGSGGGYGGSGSGGAPSGGGAFGGSTGNQPSDPYPPEDEEGCYDCANGPYVDTTIYVDSCSGDSSSSSGGDSCSGDSSPDDGSPQSCSGDTESGGGESCSGDTSDSGGDSCSGDSSSSGDSCSGDSSSGGPESCSGSSSGSSSSSCSGSSGGGGSTCSVSRRTGRRLPPLSGVTLALVALLLPLRRWRRAR
jgi:hypothetical protein